MSESAISRAIREMLPALGITATRHQSGMVRVGARVIHMGDPGWPDIIGWDRAGRFVGLEVKAAKGRLEASQGPLLARAAQAGCLVGVVRSVEDVVRLLGEANQPRRSRVAR